jgi:hypothetical protein
VDRIPIQRDRQAQVAAASLGSSAERNRRQALDGGTSEQEALEEIDAGAFQGRKLRLRLDALGDDRDVESARHHQDAGDDGLTGRGIRNPADELHVDLDEVGLEVGEKVQARVTGAEEPEDDDGDPADLARGSSGMKARIQVCQVRGIGTISTMGSGVR